jgi:hypothetical protein
MSDPANDELRASLKAVLCANRRLQWACGLLMSTMIAVVLAMMISPVLADGKNVVRAEAFQVVDGKGRVVADMMADDDGMPMLRFFDRNDLCRASLILQANGEPWLALMREKTNYGLLLRVTDDASTIRMERPGADNGSGWITVTKKGAQVLFEDPATKASAAMRVTADGQAALELRDSAGKVNRIP